MNSLTHDLDSLDEANGLLFQFIKRPSTWTNISAKIDPKINRPSAVILRTLLLHPSPPLTITKLANILCVEAPSISRRVSELEKMGLVKRSHPGDDKRTVYLKPTARAEKLNKQLNQARRAISKDVLEKWSPKDRSAFTRLFLRYVREITGDEIG